MVVPAVVGRPIAGGSSGTDGTGVCGSPGSEGIGIQDPEERGWAAQLQFGAAAEGMAVRVCDADPKHTGSGAGMHGVDRNAVADGHVESRSHDVVEVLAR